MKDTEKNKASTTHRYKCGKCGEKGHNARTCTTAGFHTRAVKALRLRQKPTRYYACSICSEVGHNRTTCPAKNRTYKCGKCGVEGHNKRGCTAVISVSGKIITPHNFTAARGYRCGNCGMDGHSRRNCPRRKHDY